jgi:hypothetical protein
LYEEDLVIDRSGSAIILELLLSSHDNNFQGFADMGLKEVISIAS